MNRYQSKFQKQIEKITEPDKLRARALYWLGRKEYSIADFETKLNNVCDDEIMIAELIEDFVTRDWLNEERYLNSFFRMKLSAGLGLLRIRQELQQHGLASSLIAQFLEQDETDWFAQAQNTYRKKYGETECVDYKEQNKRFRFMQYRGFRPDEIKYAMQNQSENW